ncbi:MAG: methyltransferase domain-containing protein [Acidimicrobiia bacterium]|nr:methyltransferase domain-containing protein [Acidimicrobiia bacterium]
MTEYLDVNRAHWNDNAGDWVAAGEDRWSRDEPVWGIWDTPDDEVRLLPDDMTGLDAIELGCGTGYVSAWMARRGARVTGIDLSEVQLATASRLSEMHQLPITLIHGNAEDVDTPDGSFDCAVSEYGAVLWCDPHLWVPEAFRLLRSGGTLATYNSHPLTIVCSPVDGSLPITRNLEQPYFGMGLQDWSDAIDDPGGMEFNLPLGEWFQLFRRVGFEVVDLREIQTSTTGDEMRFYATADWARDYPSEVVWKLHKP